MIQTSWLGILPFERFLFKLNQAATAKIPLQTAPTQKSTSLIEVTDLTIGQTDYAKISVYYKGDPTQSYVIDVNQYTTTSEGFVLTDKASGQIIFEVKVGDPDQPAKRDALIQYVFGGKPLPETVQKPKDAIKKLTISQKGMQFIQGDCGDFCPTGQYHYRQCDDFGCRFAPADAAVLCHAGQQLCGL